ADAERGRELGLTANDVDADVARLDPQRGDRHLGDVAAVLADAVELEGHEPRSRAELGLDATGEVPGITVQARLELAEVKGRRLLGGAANATEREPLAQAIGPADADLDDRREQLAKRGRDLIPQARKHPTVAAHPAVLDRGRDLP